MNPAELHPPAVSSFLQAFGDAETAVKVLVIDDDKGVLESVRDMLACYDCAVECAESAQKGIKMAETGEYELVLVDYKMPENDGIWFMQNVDLPRGTKTLLMTAFVNREVINKMFSYGASGYIVKPFDGKELLRHVKFHLTREF
ncbi:MAG: response regulator [Kiritimatiellia bacterium]